MERLYFALGFLVVIGLGWWRYDYVVSDRDAQKLRADNATADLINARDKLATERKNAADADLRAKQRLSEKEKLQHEYDEKIKCIDAGNCGVRVRWRQAICAGESVRSTDTGTSGSDDLQTENQRDFGRWVASLEASVERDAKVIEGLQAELEIKSRPDACVAKKPTNQKE